MDTDIKDAINRLHARLQVQSFVQLELLRLLPAETLAQAMRNVGRRVDLYLEETLTQQPDLHSTVSESVKLQMEHLLGVHDEIPHPAGL